MTAKSLASNADSFLPHVIFFLIKARPNGFLSNLEFVKNFGVKTDETAEALYYLTLVESAVYFIQNITSKDLNIDPHLFDRYFLPRIPLHLVLRCTKFQNFPPSLFNRRASTEKEGLQNSLSTPLDSSNEEDSKEIFSPRALSPFMPTTSPSPPLSPKSPSNQAQDGEDWIQLAKETTSNSSSSQSLSSYSDTTFTPWSFPAHRSSFISEFPFQPPSNPAPLPPHLSSFPNSSSSSSSPSHSFPVSSSSSSSSYSFPISTSEFKVAQPFSSLSSVPFVSMPAAAPISVGNHSSRSLSPTFQTPPSSSAPAEAPSLASSASPAAEGGESPAANPFPFTSNSDISCEEMYVPEKILVTEPLKAVVRYKSFRYRLLPFFFFLTSHNTQIQATRELQLSFSNVDNTKSLSPSDWEILFLEYKQMSTIFQLLKSSLSLPPNK